MVTVDLGACEWFVWDLRRSNLVERGQLEQVVGEFLEHEPKAEPPQLADFLVKNKILTRFQADSLLAGKNQGLVLGPYTLQDALGSGSMGTVYKARSKNNANQSFAVKVLPRRSMWNIRLARRKVREFEQFQHPAVVPFVDVGTAGGMHYLAWPLVDGQPLDKIIDFESKLAPSLAAYFALQVAEGLEACHPRGIIHGLLKPSNLLIGGDRQVRILDFGVGALLSETEGESVVDTMSTANTMASGLDCASPESIMDPTATSAASDQYSLGCVLYFCLTGNYPFPGNNAVEKMMAHQTKQPPSMKETSPEVSDELVKLVDRLMAKVPSQRYPSISDVVLALKPHARDSILMPPSRMAWIQPAKNEKPEAPPSKAVAKPPAPGKPVEAPASRIAPAQVTHQQVTHQPAPETAAPKAAPAKPTFDAAQLPNRRSIHADPPKPQPVARAVQVAPAALAPQVTAEPAATAPTAKTPPDYEYDERGSWEERLGPTGIVILAIASCAAAWLAMWLMSR